MDSILSTLKTSVFSRSFPRVMVAGFLLFSLIGSVFASPAQCCCSKSIGGCQVTSASAKCPNCAAAEQREPTISGRCNCQIKPPLDLQPAIEFERSFTKVQHTAAIVSNPLYTARASKSIVTVMVLSERSRIDLSMLCCWRN